MSAYSRPRRSPRRDMMNDFGLGEKSESDIEHSEVSGVSDGQALFGLVNPAQKFILEDNLGRGTGLHFLTVTVPNGEQWLRTGSSNLILQGIGSTFICATAILIEGFLL